MSEETRLESMEIKIAHLEKASQELSDVLHQQQQQIDSLTAISKQTAEQLAVVRDRMSPEGL